MSPGAIDADVRAEIDRRLERIRVEENVRYLIAVESGSRAWGFPSPDSDYDVRFVYVRPRDWYLTLKPGRDVIEQAIVDEIDLGGWDLRKALGLMLNSNAIVSEWLQSPVRYRPHDSLAAAMAELADAAFDPGRAAAHYTSMARAFAAVLRGPSALVAAKTYFYALRPALAIRALRQDPARRPPMDLAALVEVTDIAPPLRRLIADLVAAKRVTRELGTITRIAELDRMILSELDAAAQIIPRPVSDVLVRRCDAFFRSALRD